MCYDAPIKCGGDVLIKVIVSISDLPKEDRYMFNRLFSLAELATGRYYITAMYEREPLQKLVDDLTGRSAPDLVRCDSDPDTVFFYAVV